MVCTFALDFCSSAIKSSNRTKPGSTNFLFGQSGLLAFLLASEVEQERRARPTSAGDPANFSGPINAELLASRWPRTHAKAVTDGNRSSCVFGLLAALPHVCPYHLWSASIASSYEKAYIYNKPRMDGSWGCLHPSSRGSRDHDRKSPQTPNERVRRLESAPILSRTTHCILLAAEWSGMPQIYFCCPPGEISGFFVLPPGDSN